MFSLRVTAGTTTRRRTASLACLGALAIGMIASACGESPLAPPASGGPANRSLLSPLTSTLSSTLTSVTGLLWTTPVSSKTVSATIGPAGGSLSIPDGVELIVPKGAVSKNVTFSITRLSGNVVAYEFEPHGMTFGVPLVVRQPTAATNLLDLSSTASISAAYFTDASLLDRLLGTAKVSEFEPTSVSPDKSWITFTVKHFSGYMISTGRSE